MLALQAMNPIPQGPDYVSILPEIVLSIFGLLIMMLDPVMDERRSQRTLGGIALVGGVLALAATVFQGHYLAHTGFAGFAFWNMVKIDAFSIFFHFVVAVVTILVILASYEYMEVQQIRAGEYYGLLLFAAVGMDLMSSAVELVLIFIALEISSIATYILAGFRRRSAISAESSVKYFLLGSFATSFFLYGVAMMYGATGSTSISVIADSMAQFEISGHGPLLAYLGVGLMFVGLGFKVAAAPFHIWTPDVYEGAPSPVVAFMSTAPKAAVFAVLLRVMFQAHAPGRLVLIWMAAALSMTIGNIAALIQDNVKRLLAYSSIAHAGYLLVAFASLPENGIPAAMFYAASYAVMNVGAFAVVGHFASHGERYVIIEDYAGLGKRSPLLAAVFTMFLLSLIGIPMFGGFFAKFYVFSAALQSRLVGLVIVGLLNSAVAAYYYLRIIVVMYMREPREAVPVTPIPAGLGFALTLSLALTIYLGVLPNRVLEYASRSVGLLR
ncbi:MAG TPA: NADH-quinone oxidoreductase subunit N [Terriglobales bacterium]|jgi:NADH-quinone oxidoreductase subunit N|nr:NADH-quinone oxidoreductase subunit N [Terriglobales bacterium]